MYQMRTDFAIVKFECQFSPIARIKSYQLSEPWQIFPKSTTVTVNYKKNSANKWYLKSVNTEQFIKQNSSIKWTIPEDYILKRALVVSEIELKEIQDFDNSNKDLFKDMQSARLRNFKSIYREEVWQDYKEKGHYPYLTKKELADLERHHKMNQQFKMNAQRNN